jgi:hypothetical protein
MLAAVGAGLHCLAVPSAVLHDKGSCPSSLRIIAADRSQVICVVPTNWLSVLTSGFEALLRAAFTCLWTHLTYVISSPSCLIAAYSA